MAIGSIGGISVKISADIDGFQAGLNKVNRRVADASKKLRQNTNEYGKWAAAGTAAAMAVGAAMVRSQMQTIDALAKTADRLGLTTEALAGLQRSAELSGASTQTLNMALQRMTRRVAEAARGTGEAKDAIKELGLDAQALARMSPDEQFKTLADAMSGVSEQGDRVRLSMKLFDSEGVKLLNTLQMGSEALEKQEEIARKLGTALNRVDAAKVEAANDAMSTAGDAIDGVVNRIAVQLSPAIEAMANEFTSVAIESNGFGETVNSVMQGLQTVVGVFADGLRGIQVVFKGLQVGATAFGYGYIEIMRTMTVGMEQFVNVSINGLNEIIEAANWFGAGLDPVESFTFGAATMFTDMANKAKSSLTGVTQEWHELAMRPLPSETIEQWVSRVQESAQKAGEAVAGAMGGGGEGEGGGGMSPEETKALEARLESIRQNLMTEQQIKAEAYLMDLEAIRAKRELELEDKAKYDKMEKDLAQKHANELVQITQDAAAKEQAIEDRKQQQKLAGLSSMFGNLSSLMNSESRKMFEIGKAAAIAGAIVDGIAAVQGSYKWGEKIGGPPLGAAFAAAAGVNAAMNIQQIKNTKFGSAGVGQSIQGGQVVNNTAQQPQQPQQSISINLAGSANYTAGDIRGLIDAINDQTGDGYNLNVTGG